MLHPKKKQSNSTLEEEEDMAQQRLKTAKQGESAQEESVQRDPEDRLVAADDKNARREKNLDKTLADSFPTSDPPSSIPDPEGQA